MGGIVALALILGVLDYLLIRGGTHPEMPPIDYSHTVDSLRVKEDEEC